MKIDLSDIITSEDKEVSKQATTELKFFKSKLGRFPIIKSTPFELTFTNEGNKRLLIHGKTEVTIAIPCGRCLEEVDRVFRIRIDKEFDLTGEDRERSMEESEFMAGTNLDVDQLIFGEILVSWPMKVLIMSICPKNKSSKSRRDKRRANWKMSVPNLVKCSKCGELMMPHRVCKSCGCYNKKEIIPQD